MVDILEIVTANELQERKHWMISDRLERDYGVKRHLLYTWSKSLAAHNLIVKLPTGARGMWLISPEAADFLQSRVGKVGPHVGKILACLHCDTELPLGADITTCPSCHKEPFTL
jgi:hypothetical protein